MRLKIIALSILVASPLGYLALTGEVAGAWKCEVHPEQPTCTTLPPGTTSTTPPSVPPTTGTTPPSVPDTSTSTSTSVPVELAPPGSVVRPPTGIGLTG